MIDLNKFKYTQKQVEEITGIGRSMLYLLRAGETKYHKDKVYEYEPILREDEDFIYFRRQLRYAESAIKKLMNRKKDKY